MVGLSGWLAGGVIGSVTALLETARPHPPQIRLSNLNIPVEHTVMLAREQALGKPIKIEPQNHSICLRLDTTAIRFTSSF